MSQGTALEDVRNPDRVVIGGRSKSAMNRLEELYSEFDTTVFRTSTETAEMVKYVSNFLLATKISFINEIGNLCKRLDIDSYEVADAVGMDERVERSFLDSGAGFGGSCLDKDIRALSTLAEEMKTGNRMLQTVLEINEEQKTRIVDQLEQKLSELEGKSIAILGLSFKPGTDDITNSPAIDVIQRLQEDGAEIKAYDPEAMENMRNVFPEISYEKSYQEAVKNSDAALLLTDWEEFEEISRGDLNEMKNPLLLEGRRISHSARKYSEGITWP
jgi:UDPglucose 6-dehydrogenase